MSVSFFFFFFQAEDGIRDKLVTGVQTCALPISSATPTPPTPVRTVGPPPPPPTVDPTVDSPAAPVIQAMQLQHKVSGKYVHASTLHAGEAGRVTVDWTTTAGEQSAQAHAHPLLL